MVSETPDDEETLDTAHRVLADRLRRRIVRILDGSEGPLSVDALVDRLDQARSAGEGGSVTDASGLPIELHHHHLPMMDDAGVIETAPDGRVVLSARGDAVAAVDRAAADALDARPG